MSFVNPALKSASSRVRGAPDRLQFNIIKLSQLCNSTLEIRF